MKTDIAANARFLFNQIHQLESQYHLPLGQCQIIAVSKMQSIENMQKAYQAGLRAFGENKIQEAIPKITALRSHYPDIEWHYIGRIQTNKASQIASYFSWCHSLERETVARLLHTHRDTNLPLLNVLVQVNVGADLNKAGIAPEACGDFLQAIQIYDRLRIRGLMTILPANISFAKQQEYFSLLRSTLLQLNDSGYNLDTLSMGMTDDYIAAISCGATHIRLGRALFGARANG